MPKLERWADRDPMTPGGLYWLPKGRQAPTADVVTHHHTAPDGVVVECRSQWMHSLGLTFDRWIVGGYVIATSRRPDENTIPPDWSWVDAIANRAA